VTLTQTVRSTAIVAYLSIDSLYDHSAKRMKVHFRVSYEK